MGRDDELRGQLTEIEVDRLDLDPENPRLPEELNNKPPGTLLRYYFDNMVLEELAQSFVDNGFFMHEPLIVVKARERHIVVEGNRRLAALMILLGRPEAEEEELAFDLEASGKQLDSLRTVPCYVVKQRADVYGFLGFRHISGIKKWGAEAKARYLTREVDAAVRARSAAPFKDVAKRVGSNTQGVRNSFTALAILRYAHDEFSLVVRTLQNERFSVWQRALNSPDIRAFVGFGDPREHDEILAALRDLDQAKLRRVISELTPNPETKKAIVEDSRDITDYGRILSSRRASKVLTQYRDFELARAIVDEADLPKRIRRLKEECEVVLQEVKSAEPSEDLKNVSRDLWQTARSLWGAVKELSTEDNDE